ncbi:twin-arginine translocase subunit TatC [Halosimplex sp. J119]
MTSPSTQMASDGSGLRAVGAEMRNLWTALAAIAAFLVGSLSTWFALRVSLWPVLKSDLATATDVTIVATTPWDVILMQAQVAAAVGLLLAVETVLYRSRSALLSERWWPGAPLPSGVRILLAAVGVALLPVGAALGYDHVVPIVVDLLAGEGATWTIVQWGRITTGIAAVSGLAVQTAFVSVVVSLGGRPR